MPLNITRYVGERLYLHLPDGRQVEIEVRWINRRQVNLSIDAPRDIVIRRREIEPEEHGETQR